MQTPIDLICYHACPGVNHHETFIALCRARAFSTKCFSRFPLAVVLGHIALYREGVESSGIGIQVLLEDDTAINAIELGGSAVNVCDGHTEYIHGRMRFRCADSLGG